MREVSVVVLDHQDNALTARAIRSVEAQTMPCELVVQSSPHWWPEKLNDGVRKTSGRFVVPLCYDDELCPTFAERCVAASAGMDLVLTARRVVSPSDSILARFFGVTAHTQRAYPLTVQSVTCACPAAMTALWRRTAWEAVGGYDGTIEYGDWGMYCEVARRGLPWVVLPDALWRYHLHAQNGAKAMNHDGALGDLRRKYPWLAEAA